MKNGILTQEEFEKMEKIEITKANVEILKPGVIVMYNNGHGWETKELTKFEVERQFIMTGCHNETVDFTYSFMGLSVYKIKRDKIGGVNGDVMQQDFDKWDKGKFVYGKVEKKLLELKEGEKISNILDECTVCPVGNATCGHYMNLEFVGYHPDKGYKKHVLMICNIGIGGDGEDCPLNK